MPDHYGPGWELQNAPSVEAAGDTAYQLFATLKTVAATRNTLLPVGGDYTPPNNWITALHHDWNARYAWPKFVCGTTKHFMDRVRAELAAEGRRPSPQSRDMNPIYTGKDVSYIDTKQAQRAAEVAAVDAEKLGTYRRPARARPVRGSLAGQGVAAARVRRAPRRDHRVGVGPGLHRPGHRVA